MRKKRRDESRRSRHECLRHASGDVEFVDADAYGRNLDRSWQRLFRRFHDFDDGLLTRLVRRGQARRSDLQQLACPTQLDPRDVRRDLLLLFRGVDHRKEELLPIAGDCGDHIERIGGASDWNIGNIHSRGAGHGLLGRVTAHGHRAGAGEVGCHDLHHQSLGREARGLAGVVDQHGAKSSGGATGSHHIGVTEHLIQEQSVAERRQHSRRLVGTAHLPVAAAPLIEDELDVLLFERRHFLHVLLPRLEGFADAVGRPSRLDWQRIVDIHEGLLLLSRTPGGDTSRCARRRNRRCRRSWRAAIRSSLRGDPKAKGSLSGMGGSHSLGKKSPFFSAPPMDLSQTLAPDKTTLILGSTFFMASTMLLCLTQYWFSDMWPNCQGPYISLPMVQRRMLNGSGWPFCARSLPMRVVDGTVAVFDFLGRAASVSVAAVDGEIGLGAEQSAEGDEFVEARRRWTRPSAPHRLEARRALIDIAKTVAKVVGRDEVAAGPLRHLEARILEAPDHAGMESLHIVGGHQGSGPDVECAATGAHDFQARVVGVGRRR